MSNTLILPMRVDALYLEQDTSCVDSRADFSNLPYFNGEQDINSSTPYLAEVTQPNPFTHRPFPLKKGVHLHWNLPAAYTRSYRRPILEFHEFLSKGKTLADWDSLKVNGWIKEINDLYASILVSSAEVKLVLDSGSDHPLHNMVKGIEGLLLRRGDHLPIVPDRWYIARYKDGATEPDKSWLLKSDFLYPVGEGNRTLAISYPVTKQTDKDPPFRYMGKALPIDEWGSEEEGSFLNALENNRGLTAQGYGDPSFAAFYPSCFSVFGFHDDSEEVLDNPTGFSYEVMGYFNDVNYDPTHVRLKDYVNHYPSATAVNKAYQLFKELNVFIPIEIPNLAVFKTDELSLMQAANWVEEKEGKTFLQLIALDAGQTLNTTLVVLDSIRIKIETIVTNRLGSIINPTNSTKESIAYGKLSIAEKPAAPTKLIEDFNIAIGNTGTEALSAYIGHNISESFSNEIEEHLEALKFFSRMDHLHSDLTARFEAFRHEQAFAPIPGGMRWSFVPKNSGEQQIADNSVDTQVTLPDHFAHLLNQLNIHQQDLDHVNRAIEAHKKQIYADWNKYVASRYVPLGATDDFPDINKTKFFLQKAGLAQLSELESKLKEVKQGLEEAYLNLKEASFEEQLINSDDIPNWKKFWQNNNTSTKQLFRDLTKQTGQRHMPSNPGNLFPGDLWQSFTARRTGYLTQLQVRLAFIPNFREGDLIIYKGEGTSGQVIHQEHYTAESTRRMRFTLSIPIPIKKGQQYTIRFTSILWFAAFKSPLPFFSNQPQFTGGRSSVDASLNFLFQTFILTGDSEKNDNGKSTFIKHLRRLQNLKGSLLDQYSFPDEQIPPEAQDILKRVNDFIPQNSDDHYFNHTKEYLRFNRLLIEAHIPELKKKPLYELKKYPDRRFWKPRDPVVLLASPEMKLPPKYDSNSHLHEKGYLEGELIESEVISTFSSIPFYHESLRDLFAIDNAAISTAYDRNRYPLLMDWQIAYHGTKGDKIGGTADGYLPTYLSKNYTIEENATDFSREAAVTDTTAHPYWGTTVLSAHTGKSLKTHLESFILHRLEHMELDSFFVFLSNTVDTNFISAPETVLDFPKEYISFFFPDKFPDHGANFIGSWHNNKDTLDGFLKWAFENIEIDTTNLEAVENVETAVAKLEAVKNFHLGMAVIAYDLLEETNYLSQSLGGFTQALLMQQTGFQLEVSDPLGFKEDQQFAEAIKAAIGPLKHYSVLAKNAFNPIRAGALDIVQLRLIDHFGLEIASKKDIELDAVIAAETMAPTGDQIRKFHTKLKPRFAQPTRLNFRWRSALDDDIELNDHPATSPICGWLLVNELEASIMIYDQQGAALGEIDTNGKWHVFPGNKGPVVPATINNGQLRRMVQWIIEHNDINGLVNQLNNALDTIEPDSYKQHNSLALLMSRPLALVRASIQFETLGHVAINHGWNEFRQDINDLTKGDIIQRDTHGVEQLQMEVRLGEDGQLNDGLVGFFIDENNGKNFKANQLFSPPHPNNQFTIDNINLDPITGVGEEIRLSILMDPRGKIHATNGLTPVQQLAIPINQYQKAFNSIGIAFLTAPILTPDNYLHLSLPKESGYTWSWIERKRTHWSELSTDGIIKFEVFKASFPEQAESYWDLLIQLAWIEVVEAGKGKIVPTDQRPSLDPDINLDTSPLAILTDFLDQYQIGSFQMNVAFANKSELREGWLKLTPEIKRIK